ncbi:MAG: DUF1122 family protein [Actinomycetota bacterium]
MIDEPAEVLTRELAGAELDGLVLEPRDFKRGRTDREVYFNLFLSREGRLSLTPTVQGLFFAGRGDYIKAWVEFRYDPVAVFADGSVVDLEEKGLAPRLFSLLASLVPPGGSLMVIYGAEAHAVSSDTEKGLKKSFPPAATPLGYYLWRSGLRWFKDWYFSEGWMEGGMKLQATRPLNEEVRAGREAKAREELGAFAAALRDRDLDPLEKDALERAEDVLSRLTPAASP